jgi:hypothetical protein
MSTAHTPVTARGIVRTVRWAPAPPWEPGRRARFVAYLGGSMLAWTAVGLGLAVLLARALVLVG